MTTATINSVIFELRRSAVRQDAANLADGELLARYVKQRDEAAFESLLYRHGPMVLGVCRRILRNDSDAEDAFQAVFLVLVRKAGTIWSGEKVSNWLFGVARTTALKARAMNHKRREKEKQARFRPDSQPSEEVWHQVQMLLDEELSRLPEKLRLPVILCELEGRTIKEAAHHLGWPQGTVAGRLAEARRTLARKLSRHGLTLSAGALAALLSHGSASANVTAPLVAATIKAATCLGLGPMGSGLISAQVAALTERVLKTMLLSKLLKAMATLLVVVAAALGGGLLTYALAIGEPIKPVQDEEKTAIRQTDPSKEEENDKKPTKPATDSFGDPLPPGALARLGTVRLRHGDMVRNLGFSPDGTTLFSADWHGAHVWDASTGQHLRRFGDPRSRQFQSISASADSGTVALAMSEGDIEIWDATTGRPLRQLPTGRFPNIVMAPDAKVLAIVDSSNKDGQAFRLLDATTGKLRHELRGHQDTIHCFVFSKDSKTLVSSSDDKSIRFWNVSTGEQTRKLDHSAPVGTIALSPDGKTLASVAIKILWKSADGASITWQLADEITLWDLATCRETYRLKGLDNSSAGALAFTPDSKALVSSDSRTTHWWDVATGKDLTARNFSAGVVTVMAFTPDGRTLATGDAEQTVRLWDTATGKEKLLRGGYQGVVRAVAISPDGRTIATGGPDKLLCLWDTATNEVRRQFAGHEKGIKSLAYALDGRRIISTGLDDTVRIWATATGKEIRRMAGTIAALSPDGERLVTGGNDNFVAVTDIATGRELVRWQSPSRDSLRTLAFTPDGRTVYSWGSDRKVHVRDITTGQELRQFDGHQFGADPRIYCCAFSPNGKFVAFGGQAKQIAIYDMATGKQHSLLTGLPDVASSLAFSADSRLLTCGDWNRGNVHLWEVATGQEFQEFAGHKGRVLTMAFSADGKRLITSDADTTALVWDVSGQGTQPRAAPLSADELKIRWTDLGSQDAARAQQAVGILAARPKQSLPLLQHHLQPIPPIDAKRLVRLFTDLKSDEFKIREQAQKELEMLGEAAVPALRRAAETADVVEVRNRSKQLLESLDNPRTRLGKVRMLQVLEQNGSAGARQILRSLADGAAGAWSTQEGRATLQRLVNRPETKAE